MYLNAPSVAILDDFEKKTKIGRSQLIRDAIDRLADNLAKVFTTKNVFTGKKNTLDKLVGCINKGIPLKNFSMRSDRDYLDD